MKITLRITLALVAIAVSVLGTVRCSKKSSGSVESGSGVVTCQTGQLVSVDGRSCLYPGGLCQSGYGYNPTTNQCVPGSPFYGYATDVAFGNALSISNSTQFRKLLEDYTMGCSGTTFYHQIIGQNPYSTLSSSGFVDVRMTNIDAPIAQIVIGAGTTSPQNGTYTNYYPMYFQANVVTANPTTVGVAWNATSSVGACPTLGAASQLQIYSSTQALKQADGRPTTYIDAYVSYRGIVFGQVRLQSY